MKIPPISARISNLELLKFFLSVFRKSIVSNLVKHVNDAESFKKRPVL